MFYTHCVPREGLHSSTNVICAQLFEVTWEGAISTLLLLLLLLFVAPASAFPFSSSCAAGTGVLVLLDRFCPLVIIRAGEVGILPPPP